MTTAPLRAEMPAAGWVIPGKGLRPATRPERTAFTVERPGTARVLAWWLSTVRTSALGRLRSGGGSR